MISKILMLFILILINGVFSCSEMALVSLNKNDLEADAQIKNKKALKLKKLFKNTGDVLAVIQICITVVGFLTSAFAAETFSDYLVAKLLPYINISAGILETIIVIIITLILSYFTLIFGELVPKQIALSNPKKVSYMVVDLISVFKIVFYPIVRLLSFSTRIVTKLLRIKKSDDEKLTEEELIAFISKGRADGIIDRKEEDLLLKVFKFDDTTARQVMTPREKIMAIDIYTSEKALLNKISNSRYSRIPVYEDKMDDIIGIILVRELLIQYTKDYKLDFKSVMTAPLFVEADDKIDDVFRLMQQQNHPMAIVKENGRTVGLITFDDAVEEIVGKLTDEYTEKN